MSRKAIYVLRIGLAVTFIWIGVLILRNPEAWGGYIKPWVVELLPASVARIMIGTALLDIIIGIGFLINPLVWWAALLGAVHLIMVLIGSGITDITVRDIGLLAASLALLLSWPMPKFLKSENNKVENNN
ncbi:MAG: hypothetical protein Q8O87_03925 [bacterium]|nr:hypothetical protein [bacterium]